MKLFKRTRVLKDTPAKTSGVLQVAVSRGNAFIHAVLDWLNKKAAMLSPRQLKICLAVFCLLFTMLSFSLVWESLQIKNGAGAQVFVPKIPVPAHIGKALEKEYSVIISPRDFSRVERIKKWLDSLRVTDGAGYNLLLKDRPFLRDSITRFEQLYQRQLKK